MSNVIFSSQNSKKRTIKTIFTQTFHMNLSPSVVAYHNQDFFSEKKIISKIDFSPLFWPFEALWDGWAGGSTTPLLGETQ